MSRKHAEWGSMAHEGSVWETPGLTKALRACAAPGIYTAAELAAELSARFHVELSRNAIMGKCWRDGIPLRGRKGPEPKTPKHPKPQAIINEHLKTPRIKRRALLKCDEPEPRGDVADGCRWLHDDASLRNFCGAPTVRFGISWCHHHAARVWNPTAPSKVERKLSGFVTWRAA